MSTVNYSLKHRGVRLIVAREAWVRRKNGKYRLNPKYHFVGKTDIHLELTERDKAKIKRLYSDKK